MSLITGIELDPTELDFVLRQLTIIGEFDKRELPPIMEEVATALEALVKKYPPTLPNQQYVRTGTYGESVFSETNKIPNGVQAVAGSRGAIQNGRRYDQFLKDGRNQAAIHAGRWTTLQDDADKVMPMLERKLQAAVNAMRI